MHFQNPSGQIQDPVIGDARPCVDRGLARPIELQPGCRDLDDQHWSGRVSAQVIPRRAWHDAHVGFWFRPIAQGHRELRADKPAGAERYSERLADQSHGSDMRCALRFFHQEMALDQLEPLVGPEEALIDEPLVLAAAPSSRPDPFGLHRSYRSQPRHVCQCHE